MARRARSRNATPIRIAIAASTFQTSVVGPDRDVVADLVQPPPLVLDRAVVELEAAESEQEAAPPVQLRPGQPAAQVGKEDEPNHEREPAASVEDPVRDQPPGRRRFVVEVVPVEDLVEDGLVDESGDADADKDTGKNGLSAVDRPVDEPPFLSTAFSDCSHVFLPWELS